MLDFAVAIASFGFPCELVDFVSMAFFREIVYKMNIAK